MLTRGIIQNKASELLFGAGVMMVLPLPIILAALDSLIWLKTGIWPAYTVETVLLKLNPDWLLYPQDWLGLHKFAGGIRPLPLFLFWIPAGLLSMYLAGKLSASYPGDQNTGS